MTAPAAIRSELVQGTPAWVDGRRDYIGSSDLPILTGNTQYATSMFSLWAIKTRLALPEPVDEDTQELFDLGHALEGPIADRYAVITGRPVRRANRMLVHRDIPWAAASLDRVSGRKGERLLIEVKWTPHRRWYDDGPEPVPAAVQDQVQWALMVTGYDAADVAVLSGSKVSVHRLEPNEAYQADLLYIARHFRELVERGVPPAIDGSEATRKALTRLHPSVAIPDILPPTAESDALAEDLFEAKRALKAAETREGQLSNALRSMIGDHAGVEGDGYRATWSKNADSAKANHAAIAAQYRRLLESLNPLAIRENEALDPDIARLPVSLGMHELLDAIEGLHTTTKEGARVLRVAWKDEEGKARKWI